MAVNGRHLSAGIRDLVISFLLLATCFMTELAIIAMLPTGDFDAEVPLALVGLTYVGGVVMAFVGVAGIRKALTT